MELLIAFLLAFGVISTEDVNQFKTAADAEAFIIKKDLEKDYIIWGAEADDF